MSWLSTTLTPYTGTKPEHAAAGFRGNMNMR